MLPRNRFTLRAAITRRQALAGTGAGAVALFLAACGGSANRGGPSGAATTAQTVAAGGGKEVDVVNWGLSSDIVAFDPVQAWDYATSPVIIQSLDTLVRLGNDGVTVEPNVATDWKQESPTRYVYTIRDGVKFHDGTPLTADDVAYSLNRHLDPNVGSLLSTFFVNVGTITANGNVVTVDLKKPDALWKYVPTFTPGAIVSRANIEAILKSGRKPGTPDTAVIGSGPYRFVSWTRGQSVELERFDDYWNKDRALKVKKLVFRPVADSDTMASALLSGDLQGTFQLDGRATKPLANNPAVQVVSGPSLNFRYLGFNVSKAPFDDPRVRQALSLALDRQGILDSAYGGQGRLWNSTILQEQWLFAPEVFKSGYAALTGYDRDLDKAKGLIAEAGANGKGGSLVVSSTEEQAIGLAVQAAAESIGLKLDIQKVTGDQQAQLLNTDGPQRDYNAFVYNFGSDVPDPSEAIDISFLSTNPISNYSVFRDPATDDLLNQQAVAADGPERAELLTKAQARIGDQHVWVPLYQINTLLALSSKLGGYQIKPLWYWDSWAADLSGT